MDKIAHKHTIEQQNSEYHGDGKPQRFDIKGELLALPGTHAGEFVAGVGHGMVDEIRDCIHFLATPGCVNKMVAGTADALGTAANYYAEKIGQNRLVDIGADSRTAYQAFEKWGNDFARASDRKRGETVGRLTMQVLPCMIGGAEVEAALSRMWVAELESMAVRDVDVALSRANKLDKAGVPTVEELAEAPKPRVVKWGGSEAFRSEVEKAVNALPDEIKQILHDNNVAVHTVDRMSDIAKDAPPVTRGMYRPHIKSIWIAERFQRNGELMAELKTTDRVLKHEVAHMLDTLDKTGIRLSDAKPFRESYAEDLKSLTGVQKQVLNHYAGGTPLGRREVFAEAYAITHSAATPADAMWRQYFAKAFPNILRLVKDAELP
jgi:hypothetical protein